MAQVLPIASALLAATATTAATIDNIATRNAAAQRQSQNAQERAAATRRQQIARQAERLAMARARLAGQGQSLAAGSSAETFLRSLVQDEASAASTLDEQERQRLNALQRSNTTDALQLASRLSQVFGNIRT